jgi:hypothetical protein
LRPDVPLAVSSEYRPLALACQTSTCAPLTGAQSPSARTTTNRSVSGTPSCTLPSLGSVRMSERFSRSSTKYGPSVFSGVSTQASAAALAGATAPSPFSSARGAHQQRGTAGLRQPDRPPSCDPLVSVHLCAPCRRWLRDKGRRRGWDPPERTLRRVASSAMPTRPHQASAIRQPGAVAFAAIIVITA